MRAAQRMLTARAQASRVVLPRRALTTKPSDPNAQVQLPPASWQSLLRCARLAQWSGLCYRASGQLSDMLQGEGLKLIAQGRNKYTSWYIAEGSMDMQPFLQQRLRLAPAAAAELASQCPAPTERFVFLRGVHWAAPETSMVEMLRTLSSFLPVPFARTLTQPPGQLVAHGGVAEVAVDLLMDIAPHIKSAPPDMRVVFAGHSLGGALGKLLWCLTLLNRYRQPGKAQCITFGSPPVLAHTDGGGGEQVLKLLQAQPEDCTNLVLENDPVPRALVTADPLLHTLRQYSVVQNLLSMRSWLLGPGSIFTQERFVYENVGETLLLRWRVGGCEVTRVTPDNVEQLMAMAAQDAIEQPSKTLQYWLDHHHSSYVHDLESAGLDVLRAQLKKSATSP